MKDSTRERMQQVLDEITSTVCDINRENITIDGNSNLLSNTMSMNTFDLLQTQAKTKRIMNQTYNILNRISEELKHTSSL